MQIRVAVVGTGILGSRHARFWAQEPSTDLVAVVDLDQNRANEIAARWRSDGGLGPAAYTDIDTMLREQRPDAVSVATPDFAHRDPCLASLAAGAHVLVEKPLAMTTADAMAIAAAAASAGCIAMVNHSMRWIPRHREIKELAPVELGPIVLAHSAKSDVVSVPLSMLRWSDRSSPAWFLTAHDLDLVRWFVNDRVTRVFAQGTRGVLRSRGVDTWDAIQASVTFAGGAIATFESSWIHPVTYPALTDDYMHLIGERGVAYLDRGREALEVFGTDRVRHPKHATVYEVDGLIHGSFRHALVHFLGCIQSGREPETSARRIVGVVATLQAIHDSLVSGQPEPVSDPGQ
jgi:predicted dehydrogenase